MKRPFIRISLPCFFVSITPEFIWFNRFKFHLKFGSICWKWKTRFNSIEYIVRPNNIKMSAVDAKSWIERNGPKRSFATLQTTDIKCMKSFRLREHSTSIRFQFFDLYTSSNSMELVLHLHCVCITNNFQIVEHHTNTTTATTATTTKRRLFIVIAMENMLLSVAQYIFQLLYNNIRSSDPEVSCEWKCESKKRHRANNGR